MNLDELIYLAQEAKEHGIDGRSKVIVKPNGIVSDNPATIVDIKYNSNNLILMYE